MSAKSIVASMLTSIAWFLSCLNAIADPPVNDHRADAFLLVMNQVTSGTVAEATMEEGERLPYPGSHSVWYRWIANTAGVWELRVSSTYAYLNAVAYRENSAVALEEIAHGAFRRIEEEGDGKMMTPISKGVRFRIAEGEQVFFQVHRQGGNSGEDFSLLLSPFFEMSADDTFVGSLDLPVEVDKLEVAISNATREPGEPETSLQASVWRTWIAPSTGYWQVSSTGGSGRQGVDFWKGDFLAELKPARLVSRTQASQSFYSLSNGTQVIRTDEGEIFRVRVLADFDGTVALTIAPATPGDIFAEPIDLGAEEMASHTRKLTEKVTLEVGEPNARGGTQWFIWRCPSDGVYQANAAAPRISGGYGYVTGFDPFVNVYQGNVLDELIDVSKISLGWNGSRQPFRFRAVAGEFYRLRAGLTPFGGIVSTRGADGGGTSVWPGFPSELNFTLKKIGSPPDNDEFANALEVLAGEETEVIGSNVAATNEDGELFEKNEAEDSVWYHWEVPTDGRYQVLFSSEYRLSLRLFQGEGLESLTSLRAGTIWPGETRKGIVRFRFDGIAGETFYLRVTGGGTGAQGEYRLGVQEIFAPVNDSHVDAISLGNEAPLVTTGDTTHGSLESPIEGWPDSVAKQQKSSIWWKWIAPESGFYEVQANATLGFMEAGGHRPAVLGNRDGLLRFKAQEGRLYHLRAMHSWGDEGSVELTLDRAFGLEHSTEESAIDLGSRLRFDTTPSRILMGSFFLAGKMNSAQLWHRWTPNASGWVLVEAFGSPGSAVVVNAHREGDRWGSLGLKNQWYPSLLKEHQGPENRILSLSGNPFLNRVLQDGSLAPSRSVKLLQVEAGQTYYLVGNVVQTAVGESGAEISLRARPAASGPDLGHGEVQLIRRIHNQTLEVTISVYSPNGFSHGNIQIQRHSAGFTSDHRVQGDSFSGLYRVVIADPLIASAEQASASVSLVDQTGVQFNKWLSEVFVGPISETNMEGIQMDRVGPQLDGTMGLPKVYSLTSEETNLTFELAVSDHGGSGFSTGQITLPGMSDHSLSGLQNGLFFGAEDRIRGDADVGVYRVSLTIPAGTLPGKIKCHLIDAAGNLAGEWRYPDNGFVISRVSPDWIRRPSFSRFVDLPITLVSNEEPIDEGTIEVTMEQLSVEYLPGDTELMVSGQLSHPDGIVAGEVILANAHGLIVKTVCFDENMRISGTARDGIYKVSIPVPVTGFAGIHWLSWKTFTCSGHEGFEKAFASVNLPDRTLIDSHSPELTRFQISPEAVNLLAGPEEVTLSLAARDDRAGLSAKLTIMDSEFEEILSETLACNFPSLDCTLTLNLPELEQRGKNSLANIVVELTDSSGRTKTYGLPAGDSWPENEAPILHLYSESSNQWTYWSKRWLNVDEPIEDVSQNTDADEWPDLLEFALGTDPLTPHQFDPLASRAPHLSLEDGVGIFGGAIYEKSACWQFAPAPWFEWEGENFRSSQWDFIAERSNDLVTWERLTLSSLALPMGASFISSDVRFQTYQNISPEESAKWFRVRVRMNE